MSAPPAPLGVLVIFKKVWHEDTSLSRAFPWYSRAVLGVITAEALVVYQCTGPLGERISAYSRDVYPWAGIGDTELATTSHCLLLDVSDEECARIQSTCEACVQAKLQYNTYDLLMNGIPFRDPVDLPIFKVEKVRNVQAVVLIIRECLAPSESVLGTVVRTVNSRIVTPTDLYHLVKPLATLFALTEWKAVVPEQKPEGPPVSVKRLPASHQAPLDTPRSSKPKPSPAAKPAADDWW